MSSHPIVLIGGYGAVGQWAARLLRKFHPNQPLLIAGRNLDKAQKFAESLGAAEGIAVDLAEEDLGISSRPVSAVAVLFNDEKLAGLRFAQSRQVPYINIAPLLNEMGLEVGAFIHQPHASPVVLAAEWLVGATTVTTLECAKQFKTLETIDIGALLDDQDIGGPAQTADAERITKTAPAALARKNGNYIWRTSDNAESTVKAVDGTKLPAIALSPYDVLGLSMATGAPNVVFNLAFGMSSSRRAGGSMSTEIIIDLTGIDQDGKLLHKRRAVIHPEGQFPLTGLGVALVLERLLGLHGQAPIPQPGLYFPYQLIDPKRYFECFKKVGGKVLELD